MSHYFTNDNLPSNMKDLEVSLLGKRFIFTTDNGVFSKSRIDFGSRLLLESLPINDFKGKVLDVGCGYGLIGIVVASFNNTEVLMSDVNRRALHLAKKNIEKNNIKNAEVIESSVYENITEKFDVIITNPPIRAGKKVVYDIIVGAREHLLLDGELYIVIRKGQGAKSMIRDLNEYYTVEVIKKEKDFFVLCCRTK